MKSLNVVASLFLIASTSHAQDEIDVEKVTMKILKKSLEGVSDPKAQDRFLQRVAQMKSYCEKHCRIFQAKKDKKCIAHYTCFYYLFGIVHNSVC